MISFGFGFGFSLIFCVVLIVCQQKMALKQRIYELSPKNHHVKKAVSLGGLSFLVSFSLFVLLFGSLLKNGLVLWVLASVLSFGFLGLLDDVLSMLKKKNQGLSTKQKFLLQVLLSFGLMLGYHLSISAISPPFFLLAMFVFVATSNACNLTDGIDGLLGVLALISCLGLLFFISNSMLAELQPVIRCFIGILCGFLCVNWHPARLFMGDTGSLAVGAFLASLAIAYGNPFILIGLGAAYILETLSVIIQVAYFKLSQKRVFLMAPLHHHLELLGLKEPQVVLVFLLFHSLIATLYLVLNSL